MEVCPAKYFLRSSVPEPGSTPGIRWRCPGETHRSENAAELPGHPPTTARAWVERCPQKFLSACFSERRSCLPANEPARPRPTTTRHRAPRCQYTPCATRWFGDGEEQKWEHPTPNIRCRTSNKRPARISIGCWASDVGCWMFSLLS